MTSAGSRDIVCCLSLRLVLVHREKEQLKEKRRRRQELFQEQKVGFFVLSVIIQMN